MKEELASFGIAALKALSPVILVLITLLGKKLHDYIDTHVKNERVRGILGRLDDTALTVVKEVQQTFVDNLDPSSPADSAQKAKQAAIASLKQLWGPKGLEQMKQVLGVDDAGVEKIIATHIESNVHDLKAMRSTLPTPPQDPYSAPRRSGMAALKKDKTDPTPTSSGGDA